MDRSAEMSIAQESALVGRVPQPIRVGWHRLARPLTLGLGVLLALVALRTEVRTSGLQALLAADYARDAGFEVLGGKNPAPPPAANGPYDRRLGYAQVTERVGRLEASGFRVTAQARPTARAEALAALGVPPVHREKNRAGLRMEDRAGRSLSESLHPQRGFARFDDLPRSMVETLLYIENRDLLAPGFRYRSPVIEWPRLAHAALLQMLPRGEARRPGGSTLAVQIEKYRHSPGGVTRSISEKLRQIAAATLRAYRDGSDTTAARRRIVTDYVNTVPLSARSGFGEVHGIPDGLSAWFGADLDETVRALEEGPLAARALAYRRVLSLFLAQRRPTHYLLDGREDLHALVDVHLPLLEGAGVIGPALRGAVHDVRPGFVDRTRPQPRAPFAERKAVDAVRSELVARLGLPGTYDLDRMDIEVRTSLDADAQAHVNRILRELRDPKGLGATLRQPRLLEHGDPRKVVYSFLLYEREGGANRLRIQADTLDQPFNVNDGMKLDLGSTAKLRTLIHYLELVATAYDRYAGRTRSELRDSGVHARDGLSRFVVDTLHANPGASLAVVIDAALDRRFSARPARFFTGGGLHPFGNYEAAFDASHIPLRTALRHSVNLPFVRLMSEVVAHLSFGPGGGGGQVLDDPEDPQRRELLSRFAEREGLLFLTRFMERHRGRSGPEREAQLAGRSKPGAWRLTALYRGLHPTGAVDALHRFLVLQLPGESFHGDDLRRWHREASPRRLSLADRSWLTGIHPLELWLVRYWNENAEALPAEIQAASAAVRKDAYTWLLRAPRRAQDLRIRTELEREAFDSVHVAWARTGYPFASLVPSLATAIGSSADRPVALAALLGIVQNDGVRLGTRRVEEIRLAGATPYETHLEARDARPIRVLRSEVAHAVRAALVDVVENGTARRARGALQAADGTALQVGGKTGTGDNRRKRFGANGRLLTSDVASRSATLAFLAGERHFGVITAYVEGPEAASYGFTSSLPSQVLRLLAPALEPVLAATSPVAMQALRPPSASGRSPSRALASRAALPPDDAS